VTASETETQATWAEAQIKEITGNDTPLSGRHPYGKPFHFFSQAKVIIVGNHAPKLKGRSPAMERRLRVVPFTHMPQPPDSKLKEKLRAEYPAILRLMIDGCLAWQRESLGTAAAISSATSAYFEQQDAFRRWLDERCILDRGLSLKPGILLANFNEWAKANGEETITSNAFAELIDRTPGLMRAKSDGARLVRGIGLRATSYSHSYDQ
jgi:putative DNA primase/helicase